MGNAPESPVPVMVRPVSELPMICHVAFVLGRDPPALHGVDVRQRSSEVSAVVAQLTPSQLHEELAVHRVALSDARRLFRAVLMVVLSSQKHAASTPVANRATLMMNGMMQQREAGGFQGEQHEDTI
jgi:hypothetical protein